MSEKERKLFVIFNHSTGEYDEGDEEQVFSTLKHFVNNLGEDPEDMHIYHVVQEIPISCDKTVALNLGDKARQFVQDDDWSDD